jgi:hypothetical protein
MSRDLSRRADDVHMNLLVRTTALAEITLVNLLHLLTAGFGTSRTSDRSKLKSALTPKPAI